MNDQVPMTNSRNSPFVAAIETSHCAASEDGPTPSGDYSGAFPARRLDHWSLGIHGSLRDWSLVISYRSLLIFISVLLMTWLANGALAAPPPSNLFQQASQAYIAGGFEQSALLFREAAQAAPASGTLHNLGNAEWQCGQTGPAIFAWEQAQWLDPFNPNTRANLRFARKAAQLDAPDLAWYEICSTWLPVNSWAWLACLSFWLAVSMVMLPGILRWRKADWHQAVAAAGFALFLLTIPALAGVQTRSKIGVVLTKETPLLWTPTSEAQILTRLPAGESARLERERGQYVFIRTSAAADRKSTRLNSSHVSESR